MQVVGCRTGEDACVLLGAYTLTHFEDARPNRVPGQPEQRQYYAGYVDRNQQVGGQRFTVTVVVGPCPGSEG